ncbi:MAG: hypothetical protein QCI82_08950, partial [Candidatus Thermoplasmatota archaeon]|nr:hypothetical protein [Candidatus Thermoplasmatota archaeon]
MTHVMSRIGSCRFATMVLAFMMLSILLVGIDRDPLTEDALALTSRGPIIIEGNSQLASHPALRSGSGTSGDPYIFSDYLIDTTSSKGGAIAVRNTTMPYIFRNITIYTSAPATAISIHALNSGGWQPIQGAFINVTVIGSGTHMYLRLANYFTVKDCTFVNADPSGDLLSTNYAWETAFLNNTFNAPDMKLNLYYAYYFRFRENTGSIGDYYQNYFRYTDIANNTLTLKNMDLYSGLSSDLQGNTLTSNASGSDLVRLTDCNRIKIANNTFIGGQNSLYISHPNAYNPPYNNYPRTSSITIEYNTIRSSYTGLKFYWTTGHPSMTYFSIHDNDFLNCTSFAVDLYGSGGSKTTEIFRNRFIGNAGATSAHNPGIKQARDYYFQLSWSNYQMGNHWGDWTAPDDDSDGFVDSPYPLSGWSNPKDNMPVSNPYFDFDPPEFEIITPRGQFLPGSYVNFTWEANDPGSGMKMVRIREGFNDWIDVVGREHHGIMISQGQHFFRLKAVDNANLTTLIEMTLNLNMSKSPVRLIEPSPSSYVSHSDVEVIWEMDPWFVPRKAHINIDLGPPIDMDPFDGFSTTLSDGPHRIDITFEDHYGIEIKQRSDFIVDTVAPELTILYPSNGAVLSNDLVHFMWEAIDYSPVLTTTVRIDFEPATAVEGSYHNRFLTKGTHTFEVAVEDLAGHRTTKSISFSIAKNTSLSITAPVLTRPTNLMEHTIRWEYLSYFEVEELTVSVTGSPSVQIDREATQHQLTFDKSGRYVVKVVAEDPAGNTISDEVEIIIDRDPPRPGFIGIPDPFITNTTVILLRWGAVESWGIDHYELYVDGGRVGPNIVADRYSITLSEGDHEVALIAYDMAGNSGSSNVRIVVDLTPPHVEVTSPLSKVLSSEEVDVGIDAFDLNGISLMNITIWNSLGTRYIEIDPVDSYRMKFVEGINTVTIVVYDNAGHKGSVVAEYHVDLFP